MSDRLTPSDGATTPPLRPDRPQDSGGRHIAGSLVGEVVVLAVCALFWWQTYSFEQEDAAGLGPTFVPRLLIVLLVVCVLVRVAQTLRATRRPATAERHQAAEGVLHAEEGEIAEEDYPASTRHVLVGVALAVGYVLAAMFLGYPIATFLLVLAFVWTASKFTWTAVGVALGVALAFPYLFVRVVFIDLPRGIGPFDTFTVWLYSLLGIY